MLRVSVCLCVCVLCVCVSVPPCVLVLCVSQPGFRSQGGRVRVLVSEVGVFVWLGGAAEVEWDGCCAVGCEKLKGGD